MPGSSRAQFTQDEIAGMYLSALGAPNTPAMRRVMKAWFMSEGGTGNNPTNIAGYAGPCGTRKTTFHIFPIFCTPEQGAQAFAERLSSNSHGYPAIRSGFKSGDPNRALAAIIGSGWVTGDTGKNQYQSTSRQGGHIVHPNSLINHYNSQAGIDVSYEDILTLLGRGYAGAGSSAPLGGSAPTIQYTNLAAFANIDPNRSDNLWDVIKTISQADSLLAKKFVADQKAAGYTDAQIAGNAVVFVEYLVHAAGVQQQVLGIPTAPIIGGGTKAGDVKIPLDAKGHINTPEMAKANASDPLGSAGDSARASADALIGIGTTVAKIGAAVLNPANWAKIMAIIAGAGLVIVGGVLVAKEATGGESARSMVDVTPIIIRKDA